MIRRKNFHEQVVDELGRQICAGAFPAGAPLPTEPVLSARLGVSRVVLREAMKSLAAKGLVAIRPKIGTRALPRERWNLLDPQVLEWQSHEPSSKLVADLMELRRIIEPPAAGLAAERASEHDLETMRRAYARMEESVAGRGDDVEADLLFHGAILTATANQFVQQMHGALSAMLKTSFLISRRIPGAGARSLPLHEELLRGIERRDRAAAVRAAERLIAHAGADLRRAVEASAHAAAQTPSEHRGARDAAAS